MVLFGIGVLELWASNWGSGSLINQIDLIKLVGAVGNRVEEGGKEESGDGIMVDGIWGRGRRGKGKTVERSIS